MAAKPIPEATWWKSAPIPGLILFSYYTSLVSWAQLSQLGPLPILVHLQSNLLVGWCERQKRLSAQW